MLDPNNPQDLRSIEKSRNIVKEILSFGVSEDEIIKIIKLLSLELEDTGLMRSINEYCSVQNQNDRIELYQLPGSLPTTLCDPQRR